MTIYVSTACIKGSEPLQQRLDSYAEVGLFHVELGAGVHVTSQDIHNLSLRSQNTFLIHNYFPPPAESFVLNLASSDSLIRRRSLELVIDAIKLTASLHIPFYSVHAGFITDPTRFGVSSFILPEPDSPDEAKKALRRFVETLSLALDIAQQYKIQILVENNVCTPDLQKKLLLQTGEEFIELLNLLPNPSLGILVDTGHLNVSAHTLGFDRLGFIEMVAPYIRAFHVHENDGHDDTHTPVTSESWVLRMLKQADFSTLPIVIEAKFQDLEKLCQHATWLRRELRTT